MLNLTVFRNVNRPAGSSFSKRQADFVRLLALGLASWLPVLLLVLLGAMLAS